MDMPTEKKLKVSFTYEYSEDSVKLVGSPGCCELPEISAVIDRSL